MRVPFYGGEVERNSEEETVKWLDGLFMIADASRRGYEAEWIANVLFLTGQQWDDVKQDKLLRSRRLATQPPHAKAKITINHIYPLVRQAVSAIRQNLAQQIVVPATQDPEDMAAAALASDFTRFRWGEDNEEELRTYEILQAMCFGRVLRRTAWDPDKDSMGANGMMQGAGDIDTMTLDPFRYWQEPGRDKWSDTNWIIEADIRSIDEVESLFGRVVPEEAVDNIGLMDKLSGWLTGKSTETTQKREKAVHLKRMYLRPSRKNPKGRYFCWANKTLLAKSELPDGVFPFIPLDWFWIPGRSYPMAFITPLRDPQREVNITFSQLIELKNRQLRGDLAVSGPGDVTQEVVKDSDGRITGQKIIRIPYGTEWKFVEYNLNVTEGEMILTRLWNESMQLAGVHESSIGQTPGKAVTATQIAMLKESDTTGLTLFRAGFDLKYCEIDSTKMILAREHYHIPRLIRSVGSTNMPNTQAFYGAELRRTEDVRPKTVPILTETMKADMREQAQAQGLLNLEGTPAQIYGKVFALQNNPAFTDEEIEALIAPLSIEQLRQMSMEYTTLQMQVQTLDLQMQIQGMMMQAQSSGMGGPAEEPARDQLGQPVVPQGDPAMMAEAAQ